MKILHCADLHLGSKMEARLTASQASDRKRELLTAYCGMVNNAAESGVTAIIIAGDLFDTNTVNRKTLNTVIDKMKENPHMDFLYVAGNHDNGKQVLIENKPENLYIFNEDFTSKKYCLPCGKEVSIGGIEMTPANSRSFYGCIDFAEENINIMVLHGQVSTVAGDDTVSLKDLKNRNIDYLALGHLHAYRQEKLDNRGIWCYSGCLAGRGFDETGQKGYVMIDIDDITAALKASFVPFASRIITSCAVDISGQTTASEILAVVKNAVCGIPEDAMVRVELTGGYDENTEKDLRWLQNELQSIFYYIEIKDNTRMRINPEQYAHDISLKGEFIRTVAASPSSDEDKEKIIYCVLKALAGEEIEI